MCLYCFKKFPYYLEILHRHHIVAAASFLCMRLQCALCMLGSTKGKQSIHVSHHLYFIVILNRVIIREIILF